MFLLPLLSPNRVVSNMSRAFTLIEVVITIALFAIVMFGMAQLYIVYGRVVISQKAAISVALDGSSIMDTAQEVARQADHVVSTHTFSGVAYTSGTTTAVFELPAYDVSGTILTNTYDYIGISASGTSVYRLIDAANGSARVSGKKQIAKVLNGLSFTYDNASFPSVTSVIVDATTSATTRGQTSQMHLHEHFYLKNL